MKAMVASLLFITLGVLFSVRPETPPILQLAPVEGYNTRWTDVPPPLRFIGDNRVTVQFTSQVQVDCKATPPKDMQILGCYFPDRKLMVLPQPCPAQPDNRFTAIACHELGHANGWSSNHEE